MTALLEAAPARQLDAWPALRSMPEEQLLAVVRQEPCACGELVRQRAGDEAAVTVRHHNAGSIHQAWRSRMEAL